MKAKIEELRKELREHNHNYYVLDNPTISDYEFDMKLKELQDLEAKHPEFYDASSPSFSSGLTPGCRPVASAILPLLRAFCPAEGFLVAKPVAVVQPPTDGCPAHRSHRAATVLVKNASLQTTAVYPTGAKSRTPKTDTTGCLIRRTG